MSLRLEMLQAARLAPRLLGDSAGLVTAFLHSQLNNKGGFRDRGGESDLYYTVFGLEGLLALDGEVPVSALKVYLESFGACETLDFVHTTCLARCWAALPGVECPPDTRQGILQRVASFRSGDGAYNATPGSAEGTLYGCFLAVGACQDLNQEVPGKTELLACIDHLRTQDGGYANGDDLPMGLTPPTAAAASLLLHLGQPVPDGLVDWLLARQHPEGGFFATPLAPIPDLLSTATALHALAGILVDTRDSTKTLDSRLRGNDGIDENPGESSFPRRRESRAVTKLQKALDDLREPCLDFIDSLWTNRGAFYGSWADDGLDCEYTYYALMALGHLSR